MRYLLFFVYFFIPAASFALSCPNNGTILDTGYTAQQVLQLCGQPKSVNEYTRKTIAAEKWVYYKPAGGTNIKITVLFNYDRIVNINTYDSRLSNNTACQSNQNNASCGPVDLNFTSTGLCGRLIQTGNDSNYVRSVCGDPAAQTILQSSEMQIAEFAYAGAGPTVLMFENGILKDWKYQ